MFSVWEDIPWAIPLGKTCLQIEKHKPFKNNYVTRKKCHVAEVKLWGEKNSWFLAYLYFHETVYMNRMVGNIIIFPYSTF